MFQAILAVVGSALNIGLNESKNQNQRYANYQSDLNARIYESEAQRKQRQTINTVLLIVGGVMALIIIFFLIR